MVICRVVVEHRRPHARTPLLLVLLLLLPHVLGLICMHVFSVALSEDSTWVSAWGCESHTVLLMRIPGAQKAALVRTLLHVSTCSHQISSVRYDSGSHGSAAGACMLDLDTTCIHIEHRQTN